MTRKEVRGKLVWLMIKVLLVMKSENNDLIMVIIERQLFHPLLSSLSSSLSSSVYGQIMSMIMFVDERRNDFFPFTGYY